MSKGNVQEIFDEYFISLIEQFTKETVPECPICGLKMEFVRYVPIFVDGGIGYLREFECKYCRDLEIKLWRR
ncbi:MAG: hypothetical protein ACTSRP_12765 [Candidatus Helarchaeota archaeon]